MLRALFVLVAVGCAAEDGERTQCHEAIAKAESECGFRVEIEGDLECSGGTECLSECILSASCDEMREASPPYQSCVADCE